MKRLRPAIALLVLLGLAGGGVAIKRSVDAEAKDGGGRKGIAADGDHGTPSRTKRSRVEFGDKERLAKVHGWLALTGPNCRDPKLWLEIGATIEGLSLETIEELLADPGLLANGATGSIDHTSPIEHPLRFDIRIMLWQRYAGLAPDAALARAFPDGKPVNDPHIQIEDILFGVAKVDPRRAFEVWRTHYSRSDDSRFMARMPVDSAAWQLAADCARESPEIVREQLAGIGTPMRGYTYRGYASTLGEGTDWAAEVARLEALFPDPAERLFTSQHPTCSLVASWAKSDPEAAFAWMRSLEKEDDPTLTRMGYGEVIAVWMREQPTTSLEFLKQWKAPVADQDRLYAWILTGHGSEDPAITVGMLELIREPGKREAVAKELIKSDSTSAEVLRSLETSKRLPDSVREEAATALLAKAK